MSLATTLVELRKKAKLTQSELGEKLSISAQAISKWENGASEPDVSTIKKLAEIYGVTTSYIIDAENVNISEQKGADAQNDVEAEEGFLASRVDVYLTEINPDRKIVTISYLMNLLGIGLAEAKRAVENLPYCVSGMVEDEEAKRVEEYFSEACAKVALERSKGVQEHREIKTTTPPPPPKPTHDMRNRFIIANVTAAVPAIIVMVLMLLISNDVVDVLFSIYVGLAIYSVIFLSWYPTVTRVLLKPVRALPFKGFFGSIGSFILLIILMPWILLVTAISPVIYAFSIKTRVRRMLEEDDDDDIFLVEF